MRLIIAMTPPPLPPRLEELREQERESAFFTEMPAPHIFEITNIILGQQQPILVIQNNYNLYYTLCCGAAIF